MDTLSTISLVVSITGTIVGIIGVGFAIFQQGRISQGKKQRIENQYLLASIGDLARSKTQKWQHFINLLPKKNSDKGLENQHICTLAKDDMTEISNLVTTLEGSIDSESSASILLTQKRIKQSELNKELQKNAIQQLASLKKNKPDQPVSSNDSGHTPGNKKTPAK